MVEKNLEKELEKEWESECKRIYDKVYNKTYRNEMASMAEPSAWYEAKAQQLATNLAEEAVKDYLSFLTIPPVNKEAI